MSELSNKLVELGYHKFVVLDNEIAFYIKDYDEELGIYQTVCVDSLLEIKIKDYYVRSSSVRTQHELKKVQIALNRLESDIKVLKEINYD